MNVELKEVKVRRMTLRKKDLGRVGAKMEQNTLFRSEGKYEVVTSTEKQYNKAEQFEWGVTGLVAVSAFLTSHSLTFSLSDSQSES